ncbi:MAG: hypothetical protein IJY35_13930 [Clostridia bacterium]|nr:hypothetical protein [Clostridia bacterium]
MTDTSYTITERDRLTKLFLPENQRLLDALPDDRMDEIRRILLGCDTPDFMTLPDTITDIDFYVKDKAFRFRHVNSLYARIYDFARVLGVKHICDLGCGCINQAFLLADDDSMTYTGMDSQWFSLNDWREKDRETNNYRHPYTEDAPPPLFDGRIRFVKGSYPDTPFAVTEDSLLTACYSLTMTREHNIHETVFCLTRNFDRILFNVAWDRADVYQWQDAGWEGYAIHPIGPCGFVFATRHPEDIARLKQVYPCDERGWFDTGIDRDSMPPDASPQELEKTYVRWRRDL